MSKEIFDLVRGMVRRVTLKNVKDTGATQTASIEIADGIWRHDVEVHQSYGFVASPPEDGAVALAFALGGDQGDMVLLPAANPSVRTGNLPAGAAGVVNAGGEKVLLMPDGRILAVSATSIEAKVGGVTLKVTAAGVDITGGYIRHDGVNIGKTHHHSGVLTGSNETGNPL